MTASIEQNSENVKVTNQMAAKVAERSRVAAQEIVAASEELAATSKELSGQAQHLQETMGFFKLATA